MKSISSYLLLCSLVATTNCSFSCHDEDVHIRGLKACNIVIQSNRSKIHTLDITGYNPVTKQPVSYTESEDFYIHIYEKIELGDTLTKKLGGNFLLKKSHFNITFAVKCQGNDELAGISLDTIPKSY